MRAQRPRSPKRRLVHQIRTLRRELATQAALLEERTRELGRAIDEHARATAEHARATAEHEQLKNEFLATLSHELRTPLTAITGWVRLLRAGRLEKTGHARALESIERNARAQTRIIEELLDAARVANGRLVLEQRPVDLAEIVDEALRAMLPAAREADVSLERRLDRTIGLVCCDATRIRQVVHNLVGNAIKFTPPGGVVSIVVERSGEDAVLAVRDTGAGIAPDFLPHVFDGFRQEAASRGRSRAGVGLGLSIVRHVVERHGGSVRGESAGRGAGATFEVRLPLAGAAPPAEPPPSRAAARLAGRAILLVDDDVDARELLTIVLEQAGARVVAADSLGEVLAALDLEVPDALLCDIAMPGADGYAVIRAVRARPPERGGRVPAAAFTAHARREDRQRSLEAGFQAHVTKPIDPGELTEIVARLVTARVDAAPEPRVQPA